MKAALSRWDVFCRVVDHSGDAGVCWRLARLLAHQHRLDVTLWIDRLPTLARIVDGVAPGAQDQRVDTVRIRVLGNDGDANGNGGGDAAAGPAGGDAATGRAAPADVVVEGFGCGLPGRYLDAMERTQPVWINLEYLSAEPWVDGAHGLPSPQPTRPLTRWFFFPGFTAATGGLLREPALLAQRAAFAGERRDDALAVSLYCYENDALPALLDAWADSAQPVRLDVPEDIAPRAFVRWLGTPLPAPHGRIERRGLTINVRPFVPQPSFDRRLWASDLNFVRGEDSFVRAQWAQKPFAWHIYPQAGDAHRAKLAAFCDRYLAQVAPATAAALRAFWQAFDAGDGEATGRAWPDFRDALPALRRHATPWALQLAALPEVSDALVKFAKSRYS